MYSDIGRLLIRFLNMNINQAEIRRGVGMHSIFAFFPASHTRTCPHAIMKNKTKTITHYKPVSAALFRSSSIDSLVFSTRYKIRQSQKRSTTTSRLELEDTHLQYKLELPTS